MRKLSDADEDDELTKKNKKSLTDDCAALIDDELRPFLRQWGLSLDLALCLACKENQADLVEQLLQQGADPNALDPRGRSCLKLSLVYAVSARRAIELLVDAGAEVFSSSDRAGPANGAPTDKNQSNKLLLDNMQCSMLPRKGDEEDKERSEEEEFRRQQKRRNLSLEDELSPIAVASGGEDSDVGVIEYLVTKGSFPNAEVKQKTLDHALFHACQKGTGRGDLFPFSQKV